MFRNTKYRRGRWMVVVVYLAVLSLVGSPAQGIYAQDDNSLYLPMVNNVGENPDSSQLMTSEPISPESQRAVLEFWTRAQIAAAQPLEIQIDIGPATAEEAALGVPEAVSTPGFVAGGVAVPDADRTAQAAYPEDWSTLDVEAANAAEVDSPSAIDGTSAKFTAYVVNNYTGLWKVAPHKAIGRLSFRTPSGATRYCTGTSLRGNVVVTAARCVYDTTSNFYYSQVVFTPAYRNRSTPYGSFPAITCFVLPAWRNLTGGYRVDSWARHDVGVCKMGKNSIGQTLNGAVGWLAYSWNKPYAQHYHLFGYATRYNNDNPVGSPGEYLRACVAESFTRTSDTRGMGCWLDGGIQGGPWMTGYAPNTVSGYVDGIHSVRSTVSNDVFGARFSSNNIVPLCKVIGC